MNIDADDPNPGIIRYQEKMRYVGNGGPVTEFFHDRNNVEHRQIVWPRTTQLLVQSGVSIRVNGYVVPFAPVEPLRLRNERVQNDIGPIVFGTTMEKECHWEWSYQMELHSGTGLVYQPVAR